MASKDIEEMTELELSATQLGRMIRGWLARRRVRRIAKDAVKKYLDPSSGYAYYYNSTTGATSWTKPKILGELEADLDASMYSVEEESKTASTAVTATATTAVVKKTSTKPKAGPCVCPPASVKEQESTAMLLWGEVARLVQVRVKYMAEPVRALVLVDRKSPHSDQDLRFFAFDKPLPGLSKIVVKTESDPERYGLLAEFARTRPVSDFLEYKDEGVFYGWYSPGPGLSKFGAFYSHSPYRSYISTSDKVSVVWKGHFTFYAYEATKLCVRRSSDGNRMAVVLPGVLEDWALETELVVFLGEVPGAVRVHVMEKLEPQHTFRISLSNAPLRSGWTLLFSFFAFDVPIPGTTKFSVQRCREPDQSRISREMPLPPWTHDFYLFCYEP